MYPQLAVRQSPRHPMPMLKHQACSQSQVTLVVMPVHAALLLGRETPCIAVAQAACGCCAASIMHCFNLAEGAAQPRQVAEPAAMPSSAIEDPLGELEALRQHCAVLEQLLDVSS